MMITQLEKRRLYKEAFEIMARAKYLLKEIIKSNKEAQFGVKVERI